MVVVIAAMIVIMVLVALEMGRGGDTGGVGGVSIGGVGGVGIGVTSGGSEGRVF